MENNRRDFLKKIGSISAGVALVTASPLIAAAEDLAKKVTLPLSDEPFTISILQTTDVHCQVHPHDELFWENEHTVFRKTIHHADAPGNAHL